ncbi:GNAT family N-acetyltransferase [Anaerorhabdus furcosa]|uniref:Acetyltransferase (GNAT) domain-containing protein n=1 Tax=Anaerorhabdus furcosa TaxID=118967 RepID=A0A1T4Q3H2_9FIRM|nr:GNAT family N-acetyltransferase [Anaerorhabdus furcosa]SJZ97758.1 Acetyltransferase (GNAT) domain-containing protein [Anaerorhabdus furcosa]
MIEKIEIFRLLDHPNTKEELAAWFHEKWNIPCLTYLESMELCLSKQSMIPQWYFVQHNNRIIAGCGVIENDFHNRKDLTPNLCALYVETEYRGLGIAGKLLNFVCNDMKERKIEALYLVTDHSSFYERYEWKFLCRVQGDGELEVSRMYVHYC